MGKTSYGAAMAKLISRGNQDIGVHKNMPTGSDVLNEDSGVSEGSGGMDLLRLGDLRSGDILKLICRGCRDDLSLSSDRCLALSRPYRLVEDFGNYHTCGLCQYLGADVELKTKDGDVPSRGGSVAS